MRRRFRALQKRNLFETTFGRHMPFDLLFSPFTLIVGSLAAFLVGLAKTGTPGVGLFACLLMISAFPNHEMFASGAVVPLLILGDLAAVYFYRKDCDPRLLKRLAPPVVIGLLFGTVVLCFMKNSQFRVTVGTLAVSILVFEFVRQRLGWTKVATNLPFRWFCGVLAGTTTILGNAAGAVSAAYFSSQGLDKKRFMGTNAVFFFLVNVSKIPLMFAATFIKEAMGFEKEAAQVMNGASFLLTAIFALPLIFGGIVGRKLYRAIPEKIFVPFILTLNFITALYLLISAFSSN